MSMTMSASKARAALPEILDRVLAGEEVTLTRHGRAVAVVVRPDTLRTRRADEALAGAERLRRLLAQGRAASLRPRASLGQRRGDALVADVRAARAGR
jgi:prevent-host-death family protein